MAAASGEGAHSGGGSLVTCICGTFVLDRGVPRPFEVEAALAPAVAALAASREHLSATQQQRRRLEALWGVAVGAKKFRPRGAADSTCASEVVRATDEYVPRLLQLALSVEVGPERLTLAVPFSVEWPSPLTQTSVRVKVNATGTPAHVRGLLLLEAALVLAHRSFLEMEDAWDLCHEDPPSPRKAAERLRAAAGALEFLERNLDNAWRGAIAAILPEESLMAELHPAVLGGLRDVCLAQAQQMAMAQAVIDGKARPSLMAKLAQGVVQLVESAVQQLREHSQYAKFGGSERDGDTLPVFLAFQTTFFSALAHRFQAEAAWEQEDHGVSIGHHRQAVSRMVERRDVTSTGLPPMNQGQLTGLQSAVESVRADTDAQLAEHVHDNDTVFFAAVPSTDLPPLPKGLVMMKPQPYPEPEIIPVALAGTDDQAATPASPPAVSSDLGDAWGPPPDVAGAPAPPSYSAAMAQSGGVSAPSPQAQALEDMGFARDAVEAALAASNNNQEAALEALLVSSAK